MCIDHIYIACGVKHVHWMHTHFLCSDWDGWEENQLPVVCLFCKSGAPELSVVLQHMKVYFPSTVIAVLVLCQSIS